MKIGKFKISRTWLIIIIIILIIVGYYVTKPLFKSPTEGFVTERISKGEVLQEVSETGSVKATQEISLSFKSVGKIASINVAVGDNVKKGDALASLDATQLQAQLANAIAALSSANTQYNKLINGSTLEDIKPYQDAVVLAKNNLQSGHDSAINVLNDAHTKVYNAFTALTTIQNNYFTTNDLASIKVSDARNDLNKNLQNIENYLKQNIDLALSETLLGLDNVFNDLKIVREQCDSGIYYLLVTSADKTSLDTQKSYINTALTSVSSAQATINSYKVALKTAEDNLSAKTAGARPEDIEIYKAQIRQAQANVDLYQSQLNDNFLRSPIDATITEVEAKRGETVSPASPFMKLLSTEPFQVKVDIYEQDIVNVKIGDDVKINLVAFPKQSFEGKVLSIDPGEKIVDNIVYYEVAIDFPSQPDGIRSGMTADIVIAANKKENVLRVPKNAVQNIDGKATIQVVTGGKIVSQEISTGLEGNDYFEVLSGLNEGDEIITGKK